MKKKCVEILLTSVEVTGIPEKRLLKSRNLVSVDLVWPRAGIARKSAAREIVLRKGAAEFAKDLWTTRMLFREEVEGHCGLAATITEPLSIQQIRRFLRLTAKYALKQGADFVEQAMAGYSEIASSPLDALAQMLGEKDTPKAIAQGIVDLPALPGDGEEQAVEIPLIRPLTGKSIGRLTLTVRVL